MTNEETIIRSRLSPVEIYAVCKRHLTGKRMNFGRKVKSQFWIRDEGDAVVMGYRGSKYYFTSDNDDNIWEKRMVPEEKRSFEPFLWITKQQIILDLSYLPERRQVLTSQMSAAMEELGFALRSYRLRTKKVLGYDYRLGYYQNWSFRTLEQVVGSTRISWDGKKLESMDPIPVRVWDKAKKADLNSLIKNTRFHITARAKLGAFNFLHGMGFMDMRQRCSELLERDIPGWPDDEALMDAMNAIDPEDITTFYPILVWSARFGPDSGWLRKVTADTDWRMKFDAFVRSYKERMLQTSGTVVYSVAPEASLKEHNEPDHHPDHADQDVELLASSGL
jgi:hypothetical protein